LQTLRGRGDEMSETPVLSSMVLSSIPIGLEPLAGLAQLDTRSLSSSRTHRSAAPTELMVPSPAVEHPEDIVRGGLRPPSKHTSRDKVYSRGRRQAVNHVVEQDISMIMRRRVLEGYSISEV
jgi:hypothetical protein